MPIFLAVADPLEGLAALAAGAAAVWVLLSGRPGASPWPMVVALASAALGVLSVAPQALADLPAGRPALAAAAAAAGLVLVCGLALAIRRRPAALALLALGALPFRVPVPVGEERVNLLLGLYVVIAAGCLAAVAGSRAAKPAARETDAAEDRRRIRMERVLAAFVGLYALQALYSTDPEQAVKTLCFFLAPFAVLYRLLCALHWTPRLVRHAFVLVGALAVVFASIGLLEYATGHLIVSNPKVVNSNELKPYFRVNSLFFDPNIYGRFLALAMTVIASALLWDRRRGNTAALAAALALLWAGLVVSLSQSSFAALLVGLVALAALRWRLALVAGFAGAAFATAVAVVVLAPNAIGVQAGSFKEVNDSTSGRLGLVRGGLEMARDRPVTGYGSGSFAERYRIRKRVRSPRIAAVSHTTPVTVAAEQGIVGLVAYGALLWAALVLVLGGARTPGASGGTVQDVARAAVAAAFLALLAHTMAYAAFLEDPLTWALLAMAAGVRAATLPEDRRRRAQRRAAARGAARIQIA